MHDVPCRPSKRSRPVSQILGAKDVNKQRQSKRQKQPLHLLIQSTALKTCSTHHLNDNAYSIPGPTKQMSSISGVAAALHTPPSNKTSASKLKIFSDPNARTPLSTLHKKTTQHSGNQTSPSVFKVSEQVSTVEFKQQNPRVPNCRLEPLIVEDNNLLKQAQLPLINLNKWFHVNTPSILCKTRDQGPFQIVISVNKLNDMVTIVSLDDQSQALLLNYQQSLHTYNRVQKLCVGDEIKLIHSFKVVDGIRLYHDWKLLVV